MKKQTEDSAATLAAAVEKHGSELNQLHKELDEKKKELVAEQGEKSELTKEVKQLEEQLEETKASGEKEIEKLTAKYEAALSGLQESLKKQTEDSAATLAAAVEKHDAEFKQLDKEFKEKESAHKDSNKKLKEESKGLQNELAELRKELAIAKEEKAIKVLKFKIKDNSNLELLKNIAQAESNVDLQGIGLKAKHVNALKSEHAFKKIVKAANQRLAILSEIALEALKDEVWNSKDLRLLNQVASLREADEASNDDLLDLGLNDNNVAALRNNDYLVIAEVAKEKLDILDEEARHTLRKEVETRVDLDFLRDVSSEEIISNRGLIDIAGLDRYYVSALQDPYFYQELAGIAGKRIDGSQRAYEYLKRIIETTDDHGLLHSISRARSNADLKIGLLPEDLGAVDALVVEDAYSYLADLAEDRLHDLKREEIRRIRESVVVSDPYREAQAKAVAALKEVIARSKDDEMLISISEADSSEALEDAGLDPKLVKRVFEEKAFFELTVAAEERLERLKERRETRKEQFLTPDQYQHALTKKDKERKLKEAESNLLGIIGLDKNIQEELRTLASLSPIHIFNPGFQAAAKKHADELGVKYDNLAKNCTSMVEYLKVLRADLRDQLASLPTDVEMSASTVKLDRGHQIAIRQRRHLIGRILAKIEPELALHAPLQKLFHGDRNANNSLLQQGLVKTIKQARSGRFNLNYLGFSSDFENFGMEDKSTFFRKDYVPKGVGKRSLSLIGHRTLKYQPVHSLKPGQGRIHTINPDKPNVAGSYIEEQQASFAMSDHRKPGTFVRAPKVKFTVTKFPEGDESNPAVVTARVQFAIGMASEMLARYDAPPSRKNLIGLVSGTPLEQKYVGTALLLLGQQVPYMKFDHHAIAVSDPSVFNPETELVKGFFGGYSFSDNSFYASHFKRQPALQIYLDGVKEAMTDKYGHQETRGKVKGVLEKIEQVFLKRESKQTIEKIESDLGKPPRVP
ncbi:interaptin [Legionella nautarum]|uniref:Interaptin n=1 Tax=Legionella nautarum TaxID=45070 RepID=A0A0W0WN27_9GAMM|nr:interaptin [Legionella nautarum]